MQHAVRGGSLEERPADLAGESREAAVERARRPLRFLHLTTFYPPYGFGGDAIFVQRLAHALADEGHEVDVVHCRDAHAALGGEPHGEAPPARRNLRVHALESGFGALSPTLSHLTGRPWLKRDALLEILERRRPDVVHFHNVSLFGPGVLELPPPRTIVVYTLHEYWLVCPTHVLWKFDGTPCESAECLRCTLRARRPPQLWRATGLLERAAERVDAFLAPSRFAAEAHARRGFSRPIRSLPNFVGDDFGTEPSVSTPTPPYFLFAGRVEPVKGVRSLVEAWNRRAIADLHVAGAGGEWEALRVLAAGNPRIRFLGRLAPRDLARAYAGSLACIVPSLMQEVFPNVVLEAFACGAPVVARDRGALAEMIRESGGGLLYRDEDELLAALARLAGDAELRSALGARGRETVRTRWSRGTHLRAYLELVAELAHRKLGSVPWDASPGDAREALLPERDRALVGEVVHPPEGGAP